MGFFDIFSGGSNPADAAMPYLDKIAPMEKEYYNPYIQKGNAAYDVMSGPLSQMASDPNAFLEALMQHYQPSQSYGLKRDEALRSAGNTAAAGGMRGSLSDIEKESRLTDSLLGDDMQQWLSNIMGIQGAGLQGEQHLYDTGYDATRNLTGDLSNVYGTQGSLAFQGQANRNSSLSDLLAGLSKAGGAGAGYYFGGIPGAEAASDFF